MKFKSSFIVYTILVAIQAANNFELSKRINRITYF